MASKVVWLPRVLRLHGGMRISRALRLFRVGTTPGRVRALTALVLLSLTALCSVIGLGVADAREALRAVGHDEGPMVVATGDVALALSDMDAQVANVLMTGDEEGWLCEPGGDGGGCRRNPPRYSYDLRREDAQRAVLQAARLAEDDPVRLRTVQSVLDGLHQYDRRVQAAMELGSRGEHAYGALPANAAAEYRAATALMTQDLLPKAGNLTLDGAAIVDSTYKEERSAIRWERGRVIALGTAGVLALVTLQIYLAVRFRRLVSPLLAAATVALAGLAVVGGSALATEADRLRVAKEDGFDPVLALSRMQSLAKSLDADRNRALLDPGEADRYDQTYLEKSQAILYIAGVSDLEEYYTQLEQRLARYAGDPRAIGFGGFYGARARRVATPAEHRVLVRLLSYYRAYQSNDRAVRRLAAAERAGQAARTHLDPGLPYLPHPAFRQHDQELDATSGRHRFVTERTVRGGESALAVWRWALPVSALVIAALLVAGVWPRLREYLGTPPTGGEEHG
ncbi:hypothetical protein Acsp03_30770 [Actinomadura sp. NBRC 104412]|uniref:hypothetical protein n=1 Tax=Actinomadura sp. NBRC 104412 TaxID=3032203 RepID=UPI0024A60630|nr:hypothetical protein [Actinomadura sp. NBRC 104412]GLZ05611.1 hypothetical protein Acsp03_30770 [Actinomadura sp. NBRC 104412]